MSNENNENQEKLFAVNQIRDKVAPKVRPNKPVAITGFKKFVSDHSQKIAYTIGLMLILIIVVLFAINSDAASISSKEIEENSLKHQELQIAIDERNLTIKDLEIDNSIDKKEMENLENRNNLLRQVFTAGQNLK